MKSNYLAQRAEAYALEPLFDKSNAIWQSHHVTNPALIRLSNQKVFLGYRAGGDRDHYCIHDIDCFNSSLGLAVLDETASHVLYRFPYPVLSITRDYNLPQTPDEYDKFVAAHEKDICVMHDFRLYEYKDFLYVIYHDGTINQAIDRIRKMSIADFLHKVEQSIRLIQEHTPVPRKDWDEIWNPSDWIAAGVDGTACLFPIIDNKYMEKTDITIYQLSNKRIQFMHRPIPDIAVVDTDGSLCPGTTIDGDIDYGVLEHCTRPGYYDNSHVGPNSVSPALAKIGERDVYITVTHGVHCGSLSNDDTYHWDMRYSPFLCIKDAGTGDLLYYSEEPILDDDSEIWSEYSRNGRWIQALTHEYIVFAGGQTPLVPDKNGIDDPFIFYAGIGDTAIGKAQFTLREIVPRDVLSDILVKNSHLKAETEYPESRYTFEAKPTGWNWSLRNDRQKRCLAVERSFDFPAGNDTATRFIYTRPGYFDSDFMLLITDSITLHPSLGYCVLYYGVRWKQEQNKKETQTGVGLLILDDDDPERIYYRSTESILPVTSTEGFVLPEIKPLPDIISHIADYVPSQVKFEIAKIKKLIKDGLHWKPRHTQWLERRAANANRQN